MGCWSDLRAEGALASFRRAFEQAEARLEAFVDEPGRFERLATEIAAAGQHTGPLAGVPVGIKDIFHVEGLPTRAGSRLPPAALAGAKPRSLLTG